MTRHKAACLLVFLDDQSRFGDAHGLSGIIVCLDIGLCEFLRQCLGGQD
ncbi:MAG: hypothetical protein ACJAQW_001871, partial [Paracoccaceae bacterium]